MARLHTGRYKVLTRYRSYHGGTDTAINMTGDPRRWPSDYGNSGVVHFFGPFLYRSHFHATTEAQECERALAHLDEVIRLEGPSTIAAIVLEPIPGTAGIMVPPPGYLAGVREICDRYGIVFIADEVMAGFGRSGKWFAIDHFDVTPDLTDLRQGRQLRLRAAGRRGDQPTRSPTTFAAPGLPGRADLLGSSAGHRGRRRDHQRDGGRGHRRATPRGSATRCSDPACVSWRAGTPASARSAALGVFWAVELVADQADPGAAGALRWHQRGDERRRSRRAKPLGCCPSRTSTASTSCRRARSVNPKLAKVWLSSTTH